MDYLTRLIAGAGASPTKQRPNTPAERLNICTRICNALQHLWRNGSLGPEDEANSLRATDLLHRLNTILHDESRKAAPHLCLSHIASSQTYIIIVKLALSSQHPEVIKASAQLFHVLINGEAEGLLDSRLFSRSLIDLVRYTATGPRVVVDESTVANLIELLFEISTKIRLDPDILPAWFHPERDRSQARVAQPETKRNQFPLFHVLVQFFHHDGSVGDFARTGLLYLTETASKSKALETWMIESDLAPQMASGLGALYSRLNRTFPALDEHEKAIPILAFSDPAAPDGDPDETREEFKQDMRSFLSYLAFWQDALNHCTSVEVKDTLLDHFQVLFVQQLLYPSLLESSDVDGGSTAAVLAHLARMLTALENGQLAQRMVPYLLASKTTLTPAGQQKQRQRLSMSRRRSMDHLVALAEMAESPSPNLFNLNDLIIMSLKSTHVNTVNTCLKLLSVILTKHHPSVLTAMFRTEDIDPTILDRSVKTFNNTLIKLFDLAAITALPDTMDNSYQATLTDTKIMLERHSCMIHDAKEGQHSTPNQKAIMPSCKLLESMLALLGTFFANDTMTNLLLTEVIMAVASCEYCSLQGWLLPLTNDPNAENILSLLIVQAEQVKQWHSQFSEWDNLIARRRQDLDEEEDMNAVDYTQAAPVLAKSSESDHNARSTGNKLQQNSRPTTPKGRTISGDFGSIDGALSPSPNGRTISASRLVPNSPLRKAHMPGEFPEVETLQSLSSDHSFSGKEMLTTQVRLFPDKPYSNTAPSMPALADKLQNLRRSSADNGNLAVSDTESGAVTPAMQFEQQETRTHVSLNHILTNAIILQEFILEIAAIVQVRATLFAEVDLR